MNVFVDVLRFGTIFLAAIVVGGLVAVQLALIPTMKSVSPGESVQLHQLFDRFMHRYMRALTIGSAACAIATLALRHDLAEAAPVLTLIGIAATAVMVFISQFRYGPINEIIAGWTSETVPPPSMSCDSGGPAITRSGPSSSWVRSRASSRPLS